MSRRHGGSVADTNQSFASGREKHVELADEVFRDKSYLPVLLLNIIERGSRFEG